MPKRAHKINEEIKVSEVRLTTEEGEMLGVVPFAEALAMAQEKGVDLVEISPKAVPPVCKVIDYGKMLYAQKKKEQQAKKATKAKEMKGIRITFKIDVGDIERLRKSAEKFLIDGHAVRVQMRLRGRERAHMPLAVKKMKDFLTSLSDISKIDQPPRAAGAQVIAIVAPDKKQGSEK